MSDLIQRIEAHFATPFADRQYDSTDFLREALAALKEGEDQKRRTVTVLEGIVNSCVHPDVAIRALFVDLAPIRKEIEKLTHPH